MRLDPADIDAIADRVASRLQPARPPAVRYVDAAALAECLGVERAWVYAHARDLGGVRLGGPQGRLRFDLELVKRTLHESAREAPSRARPSGPRRFSTHQGGELLPIDP